MREVEYRRRPGNLFERACIPAGGGFDIRFLDGHGVNLGFR
jgi:hypothetical protein